MEDGSGLPSESLKHQLAIAVRSIQWSYGIFWSISASQPGMLEWGDGYYNGDIKTRKMVQAVDFNVDELGLQRSEQLRELYESLSSGESGGQVRRPSAALSPEDLTNTEWYYLVCMSFHFDIGQGLPGRTLATGGSIWLCDAPYSDSKLFSRSLLAKSACIQTIVCFPLLGGVVELGVTDMVPEDPELIRQVEGSLLEIPHLKYSIKFLHDDFETRMVPVHRDLEMVSRTSSSNACEAHQLPDESLVADGINVTASQVQSWQFMDDDFSNCLPHSGNSSECISQLFIEPVNVVENPLQVSERKGDDEDQLCTDVWSDDLHYQGILLSLLRNSKELNFGSNLHKGKRESIFRIWKKVGSANCGKPSFGANQKMLKSILFQVPQMHEKGFNECQMENSGETNGVWRPEADASGLNHISAERKRRERIHERLIALKSIIPSADKVDEMTILDDTIEYLKQLERKVAELDCTSERTRHDYYGEDKLETSKRSSSSKKPSVSKRKAHEIDETSTEVNYFENLIVRVEDKEVVVEMKCKRREGLLLEIINTASNLRLNSHMVQASTSDGILSVAMRSKMVGTASAQTIRQAFQRLVQTQRTSQE